MVFLLEDDNNVRFTQSISDDIKVDSGIKMGNPDVPELEIQDFNDEEIETIKKMYELYPLLFNDDPLFVKLADNLMKLKNYGKNEQNIKLEFINLQNLKKGIANTYYKVSTEAIKAAGSLFKILCLMRLLVLMLSNS